ncbi:MAG: methyltransferase family protein [Thermoplasmatota archaeon]
MDVAPTAPVPTASVGKPTEPAEGEPGTPAIFRYRMFFIALGFMASAFLALALSGFAPFPQMVGILSLDRGYLLGSQTPLPPPSLAFTLLVPSALILGGFALRWWGTSYLRGAVMRDSAIHTERLIVAGPFRWVRNPLYLGNLFLAAGYGLFLPPPGILLSILFMSLIGALLARAEAGALRARYGAAYDAYASRVPAFVPRRPQSDLPSGSDVKPDWWGGLRYEGWGAVFVLVLVGEALRLAWVDYASVLLLIGMILSFRGKGSV